MLVTRLETRGFRNLVDSTTELSPGVTVVHGPNGAGKTNLLEALYFGLTGRSCRTRRERELIAFGGSMTRATVGLAQSDGTEAFEMLASVTPEEGRSRRAEGRPLERADDRRRPAVSVFMPDRLGLVKGPPAPRRAHLDRLIEALWPARAEHRQAYGQALAQRNAVLARAKRGAPISTLDAWDLELARRALPLVADRAAAASELEQPFAEAAATLGLAGSAELSYRPRTGSADEDGIVAELGQRRDAEIARGYSGWGPHLDELELSRDGRTLRRYGSQGEQRLALLALLFAERAALAAARRTLPLMLLDDVMSELDPDRRRALTDLLGSGGQALITATESEHVPAAPEWVELRLRMIDGVVGADDGAGAG